MSNLQEGSCHCGAIAFEVDGTPETLVECNCSHCSRKGYLGWFVPREHFRLLTSEDALATYTFNTHRIKHHFCPTCGCAPFGFGEAPDGTTMTAINARCLPDLDRSDIEITQVDGRSL